MLKQRFEVPSKSLTVLKVSQILEVIARKLISLKYTSLKNGTSSGDIRKSDINVHREIDMLNFEMIGLKINMFRLKMESPVLAAHRN